MPIGEDIFGQFINTTDEVHAVFLGALHPIGLFEVRWLTVDQQLSLKEELAYFLLGVVVNFGIQALLFATFFFVVGSLTFSLQEGALLGFAAGAGRLVAAWQQYRDIKTATLEYFTEMERVLGKTGVPG